MRTKVKVAPPEVALTRVLEGLGQELIDASDEEITAAAQGLGMDLRMKGSAAFAGLKYPAKPQLSDFFEFEACRRLQVETERATDSIRAKSTRKSRLPKPFEAAKASKDPVDK
jgi:hypothetical protein